MATKSAEIIKKPEQAAEIVVKQEKEGQVEEDGRVVGKEKKIEDSSGDSCS